MGTSGVFGGSAGWGGVQNDTQDWLDDQAAGGSGGGENGDATDSTKDSQPSPQLMKVFATIGAHLNSSTARTSRRSSGGAPSAGASVTRNRSKERSIDKAAMSGGRVAAGLYGLRSGQEGPLSEIGLSLETLKGLSKSEQAKRLMDAMSQPSGELPEVELQCANAELIIWALDQEVEPAPIDLANRWVIEYVWRIWLVEDGALLSRASHNSKERYAREQEARAVLEAKVAAQGLATSGQMTSKDFETAIKSCLESLEHVFGEKSI